jgi:glycosyltransferase involved in cell wall biosynthesis
MRIVHALARPAEHSVDGCSNSVWALARAQAAQGHQVRVVVHSGDRSQVPAGGNLRLVSWYDAAALRRARLWADVLHVHSAFSPPLSWVQAAAGDRPRVVASPRGALAGSVLRRHRARKQAYSWLLERRRLGAADLVLALTPAEVDDIGRYLGRRRPPVALLPNPIEAWPTPVTGTRQDHRVVYLGRFDTWHKGLDRLVAAARHSCTDFHLYGSADPGAAPLGDCPRNVTAHRPVFGADKAVVLGRTAAYVQASRWEAFGRSLAEAALAGAPLIVSSECDLATAVVGNGCGIVVDFEDPVTAAAAIDRLLDSRAEPIRAEMGRRAAEWARRSFTPADVARRAVDLYRGVGAGSAGRRS